MRTHLVPGTTQGVAGLRALGADGKSRRLGGKRVSGLAGAAGGALGRPAAGRRHMGGPH